MSDPTAADVNDAVIAEFRARGGVVGGPLTGVNVLLLHHVGARSGAPRVTPLVYQQYGEAMVVFASAYGALADPAWFGNLLAQPAALVEVGTATVPVRARVVHGDERDLLWTRQKAAMPNFAEYERLTSRTIPVVALHPRADPAPLPAPST
ncbi:MAG: nitroreductase family deazaflavin-dependent oxidoreductase [Actinomycetota bacterium]|nr:MAG: nitroreductase family deazaflavin-dependent oxidoreductase [Actinomycetota bacterium]